MKKLSRILALSLAIVMILSGCGAQTQEPAKTEEPTTQPSQTTPTTTTPSTQPAQTTPTEPKTDDTQSVPAMSLGTKEYSFENVSSAVFNTKLEGDSVAATSEVVNGAYRIAASKTDGESWHLKLESTLATNPGSTYRVTFDFDSDTAGTVKFGDNQSFTIEKGRNTVTGTFKADGDNKYIDLQLGALAPFVLDLYEIKVEEYAPDGSGSTATIGGALRETVTEQHDGGYEVHLTATETGAKLNIAAAPASDRGVWKAKMLINTGAALEAGKTYRVSLNVGAEKSQGEYEVCFDGASENAYGALYGRSLTAGGTDRIEYLVTPEKSAGELVLRLQLGKTNSASGNVISVSGLKVEEVNVSYRSVTPAITYGTFEAVSEQHADTFTQRLERNSDSAVLRIDAVPEKGEVYESKLLIHTGVTPEAGKSYAVSFSVASAKETEYEISYNKASEEKGYGAQYGEKLASGEKKTVEYTVAGTDGKGELTIQLMLGKSPAENAVTVSDVKVCEITEKGNVSVLPEAINYASVGNITSWLFDGYEASLDNTDTSATMTIDKTAQSREVWMAKLLADTGVVPEAGKSYRATFTVETNKALDYELCYNSGDVEKGYDVLYGQSLAANAKKTVERIITGAPDNNGRLVIQLSVGNAAEGTKITISDIKVEELISEFTDILPESFSFNSVITEMRTGMNKIPTRYERVLPKSFDYTLGTTVTDWYAYADGYSGSLEKTADKAVMKLTAVPESGKAGWKAKLNVNTGITLEANTLYRVSFDLKAEEDQGSYDICYGGTTGPDGEREKAYGALYGKSLTAGVASHVEYYAIREDSRGELVVCIQLGNAEGANEYELTNFKLEKAVPVFGNASDNISYLAGRNVWEDSVHGISQNVSIDENGAAKLSIDSARNEGEGGVYSSKLFVATGFVPRAGERYLVCTDFYSEKYIGDFELVCAKGDAFHEDGYVDGKKIHLIAPEKATLTLSTEFKAPDSSDDCKELVLRFQLGNSPAENTVKVSNVRIYKINSENILSNVAPEFSLENNNGAYSELTVNGTSATARITTPGGEWDDWFIKLYSKPNIELKAGKSYKVSFKTEVDGNRAFFACYKQHDNEMALGTERVEKGTNTTTHIVTPSTDGVMEILFKLGALAAGTNVTISEIQIQEINTGDNLMKNPLAISDTPVTFWARNEEGDEYKANASNNYDSVTLNISKADAANKEVWKTKLFINTGITLTAGKVYRISADVVSNNTFEYEICYNKGNSENPEKGIGAKYSLSASTTSTTQSYITYRTDDADLVLQFSIGKAEADTAFTVSNIKIEEMTSANYTNLTKSFALNKVGMVVKPDEGYNVNLTGGATSSELKVNAVPAVRHEWNLKQEIDTATTLESGNSYRVSVNVACVNDACDSPQQYEIFYEGSGEESFGALRNLTTGSTATYIIDAKETHNLKLQLRLGLTTEPCTYTVSNVNVEKISYDTQYFGYEADVQGPISYWAHESYKASLSGADDGATLAITSLPTEGREPWKVKYFVDTLVRPKAGESYRVKLDVLSKIEQPFEICYNKGNEEKGYGAVYGLTAPAREKKTYEKIITIPEDMNYLNNLVLQLSLGNATAENEITVSNLVVEKIGFTGGTDALTKPISYVTGSSLDFWAHEDYEASVDGTGSAAVVNVNKTAENAEPWKIKLFVATGASLEAGKSYRVSASVAAEKAQGFELCFNNGAAEAGYGALYGLKAGEKSNVSGLITVPADMENASDLVLQFNLGNSESGNAITVSDIKVESVELTEGESVLPEAFSFASKSTVNGWAHEDYAVNLTDNGTSATMNITSVPATGREAWKVKMFVETGAHLTAGKTYRVRMDVSAQSSVNYEICYNNGAVEKGVGALYDLRAGANKSTVTATLTPNADSELIIQLSLGKAAGANAVTVSNVRVEELVTGGAKSVLPAEFKYVAAKEIDYATAEPTAVSSILFPQSVVWMYNAEGSASGTMSTAGGKITYNMTKISKSDGDNKITIPDVELKAGKTYTVTFKAKADKNIDCVFVLNRAGEWNTAIYENLGIGTEEKEYTFTTNALDADSAYELLWQFGSSKNNKLRTAEVEIRDVAIYSK